MEAERPRSAQGRQTRREDREGLAEPPGVFPVEEIERFRREEVEGGGGPSNTSIQAQPTQIPASAEITPTLLQPSQFPNPLQEPLIPLPTSTTLPSVPTATQTLSPTPSTDHLPPGYDDHPPPFIGQQQLSPRPSVDLPAYDAGESLDEGKGVEGFAKEEGARSDEKAGLTFPDEKQAQKQAFSNGEEQKNAATPLTDKAALELERNRNADNVAQNRSAALKALTDAIDHAYTAIPQLNDQRAEILLGTGPSNANSNATDAMGRSRSAPGGAGAGAAGEGYEEFLTDEAFMGEGIGPGAGAVGAGGGLLKKGKEKAGKRLSAKDEKELNKIWDQIERAHGHNLPGQTIIIDEGKAKEQRDKQRSSFYSNLAAQSSAGRLHDQEYDHTKSTPRASPLARTFADAGFMVGTGSSSTSNGTRTTAEGDKCAGDDDNEGERDYEFVDSLGNLRKRRSREIVTMVEAIRDGPAGVGAGASPGKGAGEGVNEVGKGGMGAMWGRRGSKQYA